MSYSIDQSINKNDTNTPHDASSINTAENNRAQRNNADQPREFTLQDLLNNSSENGSGNASNIFSSKTSSNSELNLFYDNSRSSKDFSSLRDKSNYDEEEDSAGDQLQLRSTSFRNIGEMIPRGFGAMKNPTQFIKESVDNQKYIKLMGVPPVKSAASVRDTMRQRNEEKWRLIGYNPNHGKGDMKESISVRVFKPSELMKQHQKSSNPLEQIAGNENQQTNSTQDNNQIIEKVLNEMSKVQQSHTFYPRPTYKIRKVNSTDRPLDLIKTFSYSQSDPSDQDNSGMSTPMDSSEFKDTEFVRPETPNKPFVMDLHALLAPMNQEVDEVYPSIDGHWQKPSNSFTQTKYRSALANKPVISDNLNTHLLLQDPSMQDDEYEYIIEEEEEEEEANEPLPIDNQNDNHHDHNNDNKGNNNNNKRNDKQSSNNNNQPANHNRRKSNTSFDYKPYDDPDFNWKRASKNLPIGLQTDSKILNKYANKFSPIWIVRRALCGESIIKYESEVINRVVADLRCILEDCISYDMIDECTYLHEILQNIKNGVEASNYIASNNGSKENARKLQEKLDEVNLALENRQKQWEAKKRMLESEKELHLQELALKFDDDCQQLDKLWQSKQMRSKFNKPSPTLLNMRQQVKVQLSAHKFDDASKLAVEMQERDRNETEMASMRMNAAYREASDQLKKKYEADKKSINDSHEAKLSSLHKKEEEDLRPFISRKNKYQNLIEEKKQAARRSATSNSMSKNKEMKSKLSQKTITRTPIGPIKTNAKLKLPPLCSPISKPSTSYTSKRPHTSMTKYRVNT